MQQREPFLRVLETRARNVVLSQREDDRHDAQTWERHDCYGYRCHYDPRACYRHGYAVVFEGDLGVGESPNLVDRLNFRLDLSSSLVCPKRQHRLELTRRCEYAHVWFFDQELMQSTRSAKTKERCAGLQLTA
jgi:hypothetical protein